MEEGEGRYKEYSEVSTLCSSLFCLHRKQWPKVKHNIFTWRAYIIYFKQSDAIFEVATKMKIKNTNTGNENYCECDRLKFNEKLQWMFTFTGFSFLNNTD